MIDIFNSDGSVAIDSLLEAVEETTIPPNPYTPHAHTFHTDFPATNFVEFGPLKSIAGVEAYKVSK